MKALVPIFVAVLLAPLAAAYPNHAYPCDVRDYDGACVGDVEYGAEECGDPGTHDGVTGAAVKFDGRYFMDVGGFELCDTNEAGSRRAHGLYVETATVTFAWAEESCTGAAECEAEGCSWWLWVGTAASRLDCDVPPPRLAWGNLLP